MSIWKIIAGKKITPTVAKKLITTGESNKINGFISKSGKEFSATLYLNKSNGKVEFKF